MKTDNKRLAKLIHEAQIKCEEEVFRCYKNRCRTPKTWDEMLADDLISKGVTIPVRCGECTHRMEDKTCYWWGGRVDDKFFCSYGERREITCSECKHLMFSDCYGECSKGYKGIVRPDDSCERGERKEE